MTPDANDICAFAVKRGNIEGRIDSHFYLPIFQNIIRKIRENPYTSLNEIATFCKETTNLSEFPNGNFKYLEISGVSLGTNEYETTIVEVINAPSRARMKTQIGDILISLTRPHRGAITIVREEGTIASTGFSVIRDVRSDVDKEWLLYTLLSNICLKQMLQRSSGGNYPAIIEEELKRIVIPIKNKEKQRLMVAEIQNALRLLNTKLDEVDALLSEINNFIFSSLKLSKIDYKPQLCCGVKLRDVASDKTFSAEYYHPERIAAIASMKAIRDVKTLKLSKLVQFHREIVSCANSSHKYLGLSGVESQTGELSGVEEEVFGKAFAYEENDVLYGRLRPYLNKVLCAEKPGICSTEFHVMRIKDREVILPEYLAAIMRSDLVLLQTKHMTTGNTHPRISNDDVQNLYVPVPDISVQRKLVEELIMRKKKARVLKKEAEQNWNEAKARFDRELLE